LSFTQSFLGSIETGGGSVLGWTVNSSGFAVLFQLLINFQDVEVAVLKRAAAT